MGQMHRHRAIWQGILIENRIIGGWWICIPTMMSTIQGSLKKIMRSWTLRLLFLWRFCFANQFDSSHPRIQLATFRNPPRELGSKIRGPGTAPGRPPSQVPGAGGPRLPRGAEDLPGLSALERLAGVKVHQQTAGFSVHVSTGQPILEFRFCLRHSHIWLLSKSMGSHTTHSRTYFSGDWDAHWGHGILPMDISGV